MKTIPLICLLIIKVCLNCEAVQPMPGGVRITWDRATNDLSYSVWRMFPNNTNWFFVANTTNTTFTYTNAPIQEGTMFGVTSLQLTNGVCCIASDVGVAHWPPAFTTPPLSVRLTPTNGFLVATGQWVKVSSDLVTYDDWLRFSTTTNGVKVDHRASPLKPRLFMAYPTNPPAPPFPGGAP